jgi:hypothetical protein
MVAIRYCSGKISFHSQFADSVCAFFVLDPTSSHSHGRSVSPVVHPGRSPNQSPPLYYEHPASPVANGYTKFLLVSSAGLE